MKANIVLSGLLSLLFLGASAQSEVDALRYSQTATVGTARYSACGGAFGAIGGDPSVLSSNPGGIGIYKRSEFTLTPSLYFGKTNSSYLGSSRDDIKYNFNFGNLGLIFSFELDPIENNGWKSFNMGFTVNRMANFHNRIDIQGRNDKNSLLDEYAAKAQGIHFDNLDPFGSQVAWGAYLLDTIPEKVNEYWTPFYQYGQMQRKQVEQRGAITESAISFGGNYDDKLYIGGSIGFPYINYHEISSFTETDDLDSIRPYDGDKLNGFKSYTMKDAVNTTGNGYNLKLGLIYRPIDWIRIGAAVHTPTFYEMHDDYSKEMYTNCDDGGFEEAKSPQGAFDYQLTTPMKALGSLGVFVGKMGFVSFDYEVVDYSTARLSSNDDSFFDANDNIKSIYTTQQNYRIGAELNIKPIILRGGYALYGSPYKSSFNDGKRQNISFGIGFRGKDSSLDIAYVASKVSEDYYLYGSNPYNATNKFVSGSLMCTLGFKF